MADIMITLDRPYYECLEPLELAMAMAAFDHDVKIRLKGNAKSLQSGQLPLLAFSGKDLNKIMKSLALYDIEILSDDIEQWPDAEHNPITHLVFD